MTACTQKGISSWTVLVDRQHALLQSCRSLSVSQYGTSAAKNYTGCFRGCLELSPEISCDSSTSHTPCCLIWDPTQPTQPINPAYATHHHLVLVASIDSNILDIIEINGVVVHTSTDVYSCSSRHFARSRSHQSSPLKLLVFHSFAHLLGNALQLLRQELLVLT